MMDNFRDFDVFKGIIHYFLMPNRFLVKLSAGLQNSNSTSDFRLLSSDFRLPFFKNNN